MNVEICLKNKYFPWIKTEENNIKCWLKGNIFYNDKELLAYEIIPLISSFQNISKNYYDILKDLLLAFNGSFALVIETSQHIIFAVDRVRSIPLFYAKSESRFIISDDANYLLDQINPQFNEINGAEYLVTGYVTGPETLFNGIFQVQAGEYIYYIKNDNHLRTSFYHQFWHGNYYSDREEDLLNHLDEVFIHVFKRLIASTKSKGLQIVVPLSGGLDSRIIVAMLKRLGVENVICFSYGKKGNHEAMISKQVAEALGYPWYFVDYTRKKWYKCFNSEEMKSFNMYSPNLCSLLHEQDFLAVKELKDDEKISNNAVFIPGHCGDFLAGTYIPADYNRLKKYSDENFVNEILKVHYSLWNWNDKTGIPSYFNQKILRTMRQIQIWDRESYVNQVLSFVFTEKVSKFVINSVRNYEFFGYSWRIPLWDNELMDFFSRVPVKFRVDEYLYRRYAIEKLFINDLKKLSQIPCTTLLDKNFDYMGWLFSIMRGIRDCTLSSFCNTNKDRCGNIISLGLYSRITIKKPGFKLLENPSPVFSIILYNIEKKGKLTFNGIQTAKFLLPHIKNLEEYIQIENQ